MYITAFLNKFRETGSRRQACRRETRIPPSPVEPDWVQWRDIPSRTDLELSATAETWLAGVPIEVRPQFLVVAFPRIINRLALCWSDAALTDKVFDGLLIDQRGGRRGFPAEITVELLRVHRFHELRHSASVAGPGGALSRAWEPHLQASADR